MRLPVRIHEAAEAEIQEAADFYDIESLGLSAEFADEIEITPLAVAHQKRRPFYWTSRL